MTFSSDACSRRATTLSGRIIFDGTSGPDQDPWTAHGFYSVPSARLELDVPSGFTLDATNVDYFKAETFSSIRDIPDEVVFYAHTCCYQGGIGDLGFDVLWTDPRQEALTNDTLPTDREALRRFRRVAFGLLANDNLDQRIGLFGEAPLKPVPEPASLMLLGVGVAGVFVKRRRETTRSMTRHT